MSKYLEIIVAYFKNNKKLSQNSGKLRNNDQGSQKILRKCLKILSMYLEIIMTYFKNNKKVFQNNGKLQNNDLGSQNNEKLSQNTDRICVELCFLLKDNRLHNPLSRKW